ncbi:MAG: hypothetical protein AAF637_25910 [Pseudomonadota bacterium]
MRRAALDPRDQRLLRRPLGIVLGEDRPADQILDQPVGFLGMLGVDVDAELAPADEGDRLLGVDGRGERGRLVGIARRPGILDLAQHELGRADDGKVAAHHALDQLLRAPVGDGEHGLRVQALVEIGLVVLEALGDLLRRDADLVGAVRRPLHQAPAVGPPIEVAKEPDRVGGAAARRERPAGLTRVLGDLSARVAQPVPGGGELGDSRFFQHVGAVHHGERIDSPGDGMDGAVVLAGEVGRDEVVPARADTVLLYQVVERNKDLRIPHAAGPHLGDVRDVGPLAHRGLAQELLACVAPGDPLQGDLDVRILLLEDIQGRPHLLLFGVVAAERQLHLCRSIGRNARHRERE